MSAVALGEAVLAVAGVTAEPRGLLMVLEDLHWADGETLGVVEYVTDNLAGAWLVRKVQFATMNMPPNSGKQVASFRVRV